jgi:iron complex outermembrane receptor protein
MYPDIAKILQVVITDLGIAYKFTSTLSANVMVNNLLNVYPDYWIQRGCCD